MLEETLRRRGQGLLEALVPDAMPEACSIFKQQGMGLLDEVAFARALGERLILGDSEGCFGFGERWRPDVGEGKGTRMRSLPPPEVGRDRIRRRS